ncbi:MAG: hypothetical protein AVDCRST_MAG88-553 [uncultured Thermomicrobiales bacterium]|uniref:Uncharacterized protein n=1 Tax=uncultured Thermomicrobiales bacterium TaxID=1645740 RepID=A0A6J4UFM9_9BACT|nr:MAG: hypothetical protein AVDCRST_MAG88-553 [uncultured Thermomicrobiales bacterium]
MLVPPPDQRRWAPRAPLNDELLLIRPRAECRLQCREVRLAETADDRATMSIDEAPRDGDRLLGRLAGSVDDLGHTRARRAVKVEARVVADHRDACTIRRGRRELGFHLARDIRKAMMG